MVNTRVFRSIRIDIPNRLNLLITGVCIAAAISLLSYASRTQSSWGRLAAAIAFSFVGNTIFSMLHEAVHRTANSNVIWNDWIGRICAAFFPTGFTFQRQCHLGHHRRNRTDHEMFDSYYSYDNKLLKYAQLYVILLGFYWTAAPIGCVLYLFAPWLLENPLLKNRKSAAITHMGADAMVTSIKRAPPVQTRLEILFTLGVQILVWKVFDLNWVGWLSCYWAFAVNWGGLQYADHAWSKRDIRTGAWNLRVSKLTQYLFLNYHHHLAHHQFPQVPWFHLEKFVDFQQERPSFISIYLKLWKGPTLATEAAPVFNDPELEELLRG